MVSSLAILRMLFPSGLDYLLTCLPSHLCSLISLPLWFPYDKCFPLRGVGGRSRGMVASYGTCFKWYFIRSYTFLPFGLSISQLSSIAASIFLIVSATTGKNNPIQPKVHVPSYYSSWRPASTSMGILKSAKEISPLFYSSHEPHFVDVRFILRGHTMPYLDGCP